jgi:ABC-2 type transport system permease protein
MLHLIKLEWLKVKNYRTFWVILILYLICIVGVNYIVYEVQLDIFGDKAKKDPTNFFLKMFLENPPYAFPLVWQMACQAATYLLIIPGLLTVILFTNEYNYKTHRQNLIDGMTRTRFITAKVLNVIILALISTIVVGITAIAFGYTGNKPFSWQGVHNLVYFFIEFLNYCFLALLFSVLFKRSGITIGVYFLYVVILELIIFFAFRAYDHNYGYFLPVESADALINAPVAVKAQKALFMRPDIKYVLITCISYLALYLFFSYRKFQKDDL